jgi:nucleotide-binding universal stress UspA family protein
LGNPQRILIASTGKAFEREVLDRAIALARKRGAKVSVLQIMRIWGTGLGLPHPGLKPNKAEQDFAIQTLNEALEYVAKRNIPISGQQIIGTRSPSKVILREAARLGIGTIIMGAPPKARRADFGWHNEAHRVARKAQAEVILVVREPAKA